MIPPINFKKWIADNQHLLKPPVNNQVVYQDTDFIIMVVGGPNARKDYHYNEGEEFFYQLEGNMTLRTMQHGKRVDIAINEGDIFLLPPRTYHSPQRFSNTIGLVIERKRTDDEMDRCAWFCESCDHVLHEEIFPLKNIVTELPVLIQKFYDSEELRTCKYCDTVMSVPTYNI